MLLSMNGMFTGLRLVWQVFLAIRRNPYTYCWAAERGTGFKNKTSAEEQNPSDARGHDFNLDMSAEIQCSNPLRSPARHLLVKWKKKDKLKSSSNIPVSKCPLFSQSTVFWKWLAKKNKKIKKKTSANQTLLSKIAAVVRNLTFCWSYHWLFFVSDIHDYKRIS